MLNLIFRRAFAAGLAVLLAVFAIHYLSLPQGFLVTITAVLIVQSPLGSFVSHCVKRFLIIILSVTLVSLLTSYDHQHVVYVHALDVIIGTLIGISMGLLFLPKRIDEEFRRSITPILMAYETYFSGIMDFLFREPHAEQTIQDKRIAVENALQTFPSWVYEPGFSPSLRQGYRHFLVRLDQLGQILFALNHLAQHSFDPAILSELREPLMHCTEQIKNLLQALITVLNLKTLTEGVDDVADAIVALDKAFNQTFPESADISADYLYSAELIYSLKDLREILLKLAEALR